MPGDYSRVTFKRENLYSGVLKQQGRVQLDADDNEQLSIQHYRDETEATTSSVRRVFRRRMTVSGLTSRPAGRT